MDYYAKAERLNDKDFKQLIGVEKETFKAMVKILNTEYASRPKKMVFWKKETTHAQSAGNCEQNKEHNYMHCRRLW